MKERRQPKGSSMARVIKWAADARKKGVKMSFPNEFANGRPLRAARHKNGVGRPKSVNLMRGITSGSTGSRCKPNTCA